MSIAYADRVSGTPAEPVHGVAERRPATDAEARALASTLRLRILRVCWGHAHTNKEIAEVLGKDPATTLHHVRRLLDTGFLEAQPVRRGTRGSREIPYLSTGKSWRLSMPSHGTVMLATFLEELDLVPPDEVAMSRLGLRLTTEDKQEFETRLQALLDEFAGRPETPGARAWSLFYASHPDPNRP